MKYYNLTSKECFEKLKSNKDGLSEVEAEKRLKENGPNKLKEAKKESNLAKFLSQFKNLMIIVLLLASIVSFIISYINQESYLDSIIILLIVIINAILGYLEERKAGEAIESLKKMQTTKVKVRREGKVRYLNSEDLVIGDIVLLEAGDKVAADARLIFSNVLKVDESSLTGESDSVLKNTNKIAEEVPLSDRHNMVYAGTNVVYGKGECVVTKTAMATEIGLIASSLGNTKPELTPLQKKINGISKVLTIIISIVILAMFIVSIIKDMKITEALLLAISLAVAAIPEGLPAVITVILSLGMSTLASKKAIVRKMSSVETLGSTEVICTDKTGTITQNKMELKELYYNDKTFNNEEMMPENMFLYNMALNNDVEVNEQGLIGEATEIAIINYLEKIVDPFKLKEKYLRTNEIPFDSERKMMSVVSEINGKKYLFTKGSFDSVIACSTKIEKNNQIIALTKKECEKLKEIEQDKSNRALRLLAFAYKEIKDDNISENDLIFQGLTGVIDPPRTDVKESIALCKSAHIKPIMITGDSLNTAVAIAKDIDIITSEEEAITGNELDKLSEEELFKNIEKYKVYARVSPMNKLSIVNTWKKKGCIVAMTGDGVNDAPAIKASDIGIGMGITGTEVSKSVADIILVDDSFSTIVTAVKEGRRIFDNIRNVITYLLIGNITEVITVFIGLIFGYTIFVPIQLLFINLITDSIPAIALAFEEADSDIMKRGIRKNKSFFTPFLISKILVSSILKSIAILFVYFLNLHLSGPEVAETTAFLCLIILELFFAYSCKNIKKPVINKNIFNNSKLNISIIILMIIATIIFLTPIKTIFNLTSITLIELLYCFVIIIFMVVIDELLKVKLAQRFKD